VKLAARRSLVDRYLSSSRRHPLALTGAGLAVILVGFIFSARLALKSDFVELLPKNDRNVEVFGEVVRRVGSASSLLIGVESEDFAANKRFVEDLAARLKAYPRGRIARVAYHIEEEKQFFDSHKYLYASYDDLVAIRDDLRSRLWRKRRRGPFALDLDDDDEDRGATAAAPASGSTSSRSRRSTASGPPSTTGTSTATSPSPAARCSPSWCARPAAPWRWGGRRSCSISSSATSRRSVPRPTIRG
jgi:hypothetical protein